MASPHTSTKASPQAKKVTVKEEALPTVKTDDKTLNRPIKNDANFALPAKPTQSTDDKKDGDKTEDAHFSKEPNPFENAFGAPSDTPGKPSLPGVTSLTSPAPLLGGITPGWPESLRSGPLSPAMLTGPTTNADYFSHEPNFAGSFPTPNESSMRTGLTPGGSGSMFPQPSPNSQAIFNAMQNGGATPSTLDFHRTAMHARAANGAPVKHNADASKNMNPAGNPLDRNIQPNLEQHDTDAANGLFMLAQARSKDGSQYPVPGQQAQMNYMPAGPTVPQAPPQPIDNAKSGDLAKRAAKNSIASNMSGDTGNDDEEEDGSDSGQKGGNNGKSKGRGKKGSTAKPSSNGRRKAEDTPNKPTANKKQKGNNGASVSMEDFGEGEGDQSEEEPEATHHPDGRKLTDEEKRKNFLERNRIAALKCRQRKKQWLANLQHKVEVFSTENDTLASQVTQLREEVVGLKTLLLAHKDCPISHAQGIGGMAMQSVADPHQFGSHAYAMAMNQSMHQLGMAQAQAQANMQQRR